MLCRARRNRWMRESVAWCGVKWSATTSLVGHPHGRAARLLSSAARQRTASRRTRTPPHPPTLPPRTPSGPTTSASEVHCTAMATARGHPFHGQRITATQQRHGFHSQSRRCRAAAQPRSSCGVNTAAVCMTDMMPGCDHAPAGTLGMSGAATLLSTHCDRWLPLPLPLPCSSLSHTLLHSFAATHVVVEMSFGQLVIGPPGAGKSTYCTAMHAFLTQQKR